MATDQHMYLGADCLEELQLMKWTWWQDLVDPASVNLSDIEEINLDVLLD